MSEYVPEPYALILLALAAWRCWKLLADDRLTDRPVQWFLARPMDPKWPWRSGSRAKRDYWHEFIRCPYCLGTWIVGAWWLAWIFWPSEVEVAAVLPALMAIVGLIGTAWSAISE